MNPPDWPRGPSVPPLTSNRTRVTSLQNFTSIRDSDRRSLDEGIHAYCMQAVSVWGETLSFLWAVQSGIAEKAWAPTSAFNQLIVKLYDLDSGVTETHALRFVLFHQRSAEELQRNSTYWRPWVLTQFLFHGCQSVLHHPFVHLLAMRTNQGPRTPSFFIQKTIDQALFHSAWVARLLDLCETVEFELDDPLIGHLAAATMTVLWVFQFAPDPSISAQAVQSIAKCQAFITRLSRLWPHFAYQAS